MVPHGGFIEGIRMDTFNQTLPFIRINMGSYKGVKFPLFEHTCLHEAILKNLFDQHQFLFMGKSVTHYCGIT